MVSGIRRGTDSWVSYLAAGGPLTLPVEAISLQSMEDRPSFYRVIRYEDESYNPESIFEMFLQS